MSRYSLRTIAEVGVSLGLAVVFQYIRVFEMPQGGSVSLEMLPLLYLSIMRGAGVGILAGGLYGVVQLLLKPYVIHPVQFVFDYPLAFGLLGLAGFWQTRPLLGTTLGVTGRFVAHVISGVIFFASYAPKGTNVWVYSLGYNASYMAPEWLITMVAVALLSKRGDLFGKRGARG